MLTKIATTSLVAVAILGAVMNSTPGNAGNWQPASYQAAPGAITVSLFPTPQTLRGKLVEDAYGRPLGRVVSISVNRDGKADVVNVEVGGLLNLGNRVMPFAADRIVYYPARGKLVASNEPSPIPNITPNSPTQASVKRQAPSPTIIRD